MKAGFATVRAIQHSDAGVQQMRIAGMDFVSINRLPKRKCSIYNIDPA